MTHQLPSENALSSAIKRWALIDEAGIDLSFMDRQHRRRLSTTSRLALTAYHRCNQDLVAYRTVFASRYGEYSRTFGILTDLAAGEPASPAAFSVSVHNVPAGVLGIATHNTAASNTVAAGAASLEAGFVDAATQLIETCEDVILVFVDEPLPALYRACICFSVASDPGRRALSWPVLVARVDWRAGPRWRAWQR
jgi:hypothetical protein